VFFLSVPVDVSFYLRSKGPWDVVADKTRKELVHCLIELFKQKLTSKPEETFSPSMLQPNI